METTERQGTGKRGRKAQGRYFKVNISEKAFEELTAFVTEANRNARKRVRSPEVLEFAISKLSTSDIQAFLERVYTAQDRFDVLLETTNSSRLDAPVTRDELMQQMLDAYVKLTKAKGK